MASRSSTTSDHPNTRSDPPSRIDVPRPPTVKALPPLAPGASRSSAAHGVRHVVSAIHVANRSCASLPSAPNTMGFSAELEFGAISGCDGSMPMARRSDASGRQSSGADQYPAIPPAISLATSCVNTSVGTPCCCAASARSSQGAIRTRSLEVTGALANSGSVQASDPASSVPPPFPGRPPPNTIDTTERAMPNATSRPQTPRTAIPTIWRWFGAELVISCAIRRRGAAPTGRAHRPAYEEHAISTCAKHPPSHGKLSTPIAPLCPLLPRSQTPEVWGPKPEARGPIPEA